MFRWVILGLLREKGGPLHGYALMKAYKRLCGVEINTGSIYRDLEWLCDKGLVRPLGSQDLDPQRKNYEITQAGSVAFEKWIRNANISKIGYYEDEFSSRAALLRQATPDVVLDVLDRWKDELLHLSKLIQRERRDALENDLSSPGVLFDPLPALLTRWLKHIESDLLFIDDLRAGYEAWRNGVTSPAGAPPPPTESAPPAAAPGRLRRTK
jgi:DNA-binding PadR family transcriptional regulator